MTDKAREEFDRKHESAISEFKDWYCSDDCPSELDTGMFEMARSAWLAAKEMYEPRWMPIETAPKDAAILCIDWGRDDYSESSVWIPLPPAPSTQGEE